MKQHTRIGPEDFIWFSPMTREKWRTKLRGLPGGFRESTIAWRCGSKGEGLAREGMIIEAGARGLVECGENETGVDPEWQGIRAGKVDAGGKEEGP